ncbi:MAG: hypothetical protein PHO37_15965 [Kiritimatiellae bacterium]|nr:hypothetical protein [Kiritimatiellia bacterium]
MMFENTTLILSADANDGVQNIKHTAVQRPCNPRSLGLCVRLRFTMPKGRQAELK